MKTYDIPLLIRGRLISDNLVEFEGRRGEASMQSPLFGVPWRDLYFPAGVQNVTVRGVWGYTDFDGSPLGKTPDLIAHASKLLTMRELPGMANIAERDDARNRHRITSERTRDQSYTRSADPETPFTGDRAIDDILLLYRAPLRLGSA